MTIMITRTVVLALAALFMSCGTSRVLTTPPHLTVGSIGSAVITMHALNATTIVAVAEDSGVVRSTDGGAHWSAMMNGLPTRYVSSFASNTRGDLFAGTIGSGIYRMLAGTDVWTRVDTSAPKGALARVPAITISRTDNVLFAATLEHGVYRSSDNGVTWRNFNVGLGIMNVNAITCSDDNVVYVRCVGGGMFRHAANWDEWRGINEGLEDPYVTTVASHRGGTVLIGTRNGSVYRLSDRQNAWDNISGNIPGYYITEMASTMSGVVLAGTKSGLYRCNLTTRQWTLADSALAGTYVRSLAVMPDGTVFIGGNEGEIAKVFVPAD